MSARALVSRVSIPLAICAIGALTAAAMLARPGPSAQTDTQAPAQDAQSPAPPAPSGDTVIEIADFVFDQNVTVSPGESITVTNADGVVHTLTSVDAAFDTGNIAGGATGSFIAPEVAGTYSFFCAIHPSMSGTLTVAP